MLVATGSFDSPGGPTRAEAGWVVDWGEWSLDLDGQVALAAATFLGGGEAFEETLRPFESCLEFDERVEKAPARYATARALTERACEEYRRLPELGRRVAEGDLAVTQYGEVSQRANLLFEDAREAVRVRLSFNRVLPRRGGETTTSRVEPRLGSVVSGFVGKPVEARCWSPADWATVVREEHAFYGTRLGIDLVGFAQVGVTNRSEVHLAPLVCGTLAAQLYGSAPNEVSLAYAVEVLTHEAEHIVSPSSGEDVTDCFAAQELGRMARLLDIPAETAGDLPGVYWDHWYDQQPDEYRTDACREDGPLDQTPDDGVWP